MNRKKVLVVDDDADLRYAMGIRLRAGGYEPLFGVDALSAVAIAQKERPDLVILDIGLPGGDGFTVMKRMKAHPVLAATPVIVITGRDAQSTRGDAFKAGAEAFFQKPVDGNLLMATIDRTCPVQSECGPKKILLVEDDEDSRRCLSIRLKASGYATVMARDAISAIPIAVKEQPDLIIIDLGLPGGDGLKVVERMRLNPVLCGTPIIVLTARDPAAALEHSLKAGCRAFFQKPADNEEFLSAIRKELQN